MKKLTHLVINMAELKNLLYFQDEGGIFWIDRQKKFFLIESGRIKYFKNLIRS